MTTYVLLLLLLLPGVLGGLKTFLIASNNFSGTITEDLLYLPAIRHIDMSDNKFFGILPAVALGWVCCRLPLNVITCRGYTSDNRLFGTLLAVTLEAG
jgi:hypothetical protein